MSEQSRDFREYDIRGQICPSTLLTALREVNRYRQELRAGRLHLVFFTDNRASTGTIPEAVRNMGYRVAVDPCEGGYRIVVEASC
jgi:TusA-related sulfurtransferase